MRLQQSYTKPSKCCLGHKTWQIKGKSTLNDTNTNQGHVKHVSKQQLLPAKMRIMIFTQSKKGLFQIVIGDRIFF